MALYIGSGAWDPPRREKIEERVMPKIKMANFFLAWENEFVTVCGFKLLPRIKKVFQLELTLLKLIEMLILRASA